MDEESSVLLDDFNPRKTVTNGHAAVGHKAYNVLPLYRGFQIGGPAEIKFCKDHSLTQKLNKGFWTGLTFPISWAWVAARTYLIPAGHIGVSVDNGEPEFLPPGWHYLGSAFRSMVGRVNVNSSKPIINLTQGIVTVPDGSVGIAQDRGRYILLGPGMHQWDSPTFKWDSLKVLSNDQVLQLGPYTLVTVPPGEVAITENNGELVILGENEKIGGRTHFLDHSKWNYKGMLSTQVQFDELPSSNLLSSDRVEVSLDSTATWHIVDAVKVGLAGAHTMVHLRETVHRAARACLSNMIAHREISNQAIARSVEKLPNPPAGPPLFDHTEDQSQRANRQQLAECNAGLERIGVEVTQLAIVRMTINHADIRQKINEVAAIPAQTQKIVELGRAEAEKSVIAAQGLAKAKMLEAEAEANAIITIAKAQEEAGRRLGEAGSTASTLAQIAATGTALRNANSTVYFAQAGQTPNLLLQTNNKSGV